MPKLGLHSGGGLFNFSDMELLIEAEKIMDKYNCAFHQVNDYSRKEENIEKGNKLCIRCEGTGNELFSMYRECEACNGSGVFNRSYEYDYRLTGTQKRVLVTLQRHWRFGNGGNSWKSFDKLAKHINRPLKETKEAVRDMAKKDILTHNVAVNTDGIPQGSGYFLTFKWE